MIYWHVLGGYSAAIGACKKGPKQHKGILMLAAMECVAGDRVESATAQQTVPIRRSEWPRAPELLAAVRDAAIKATASASFWSSVSPEGLLRRERRRPCSIIWRTSGSGFSLLMNLIDMSS